MKRKIARVLVWLALAACLLADLQAIDPFFSRLMAPYAEPYGLLDWLTLAAYALGQAALVWAEIRLRPARPILSLK